MDKLFQGLAIKIKNLKRKEARLTAKVDCRNLGKALLAALAKMSKGIEKLHLKILFWIHGPDRPLGCSLCSGLCLKKIRIYIESSLYSRQLLECSLGYCWVKIARSKRVRRRHMEYEPEMMSGGLEITMVEPNSWGFRCTELEFYESDAKNFVACLILSYNRWISGIIPHAEVSFAAFLKTPSGGGMEYKGSQHGYTGSLEGNTCREIFSTTIRVSASFRRHGRYRTPVVPP